MHKPITFGTDGWRAIIADDFTFENVERVTFATGLYIKEKYYSGVSTPPVLIGYDTRFMAEKFAERAAHVLSAMGIEVRLAERDLPTPVIAWATQQEPTAGALQFTASHNPPEYCGIKYIPDYAGPATNDITNKIASNLKEYSADRAFDAKPVPSFDPRNAYLRAIKSMVDWDRICRSNLRIACDTIYSTSRGYLDSLLAETGLPTKALHTWRDPLFGGGMPEPKPEYLRELIALIQTGGYDAGFATDGDADRFGVIDETGAYMTPNQLLCMLTRHLVKNRGMSGAVVRTVATTHLLDRVCEKYGLELHETPVGFKYIGEAMRTGDVLIGGEDSGGVSIKGHIPEKDGILGSLLTLEMTAFEHKPLSAIWRDVLAEVGPAPYATRRDMRMTADAQKRLMESLSAHPFEKIGEVKVERLGRADGLKFYLDSQNWVLVRSSGTEPLLRLYFEGTSQEKVAQTIGDFVKQVEQIISKVSAG